MENKSPVKLLVYKLESAGGYHLSIYVFGKEYSYGATGIKIQYGGSYKEPEKLFMGYTVKTKNDLFCFLEKIRNAWTVDKYNVFSHNGHHFAQEILNYLKITQPILVKKKMENKSIVKLLAYKLEVEVGYHLSIYVFGKEYSYGDKGMTIQSGRSYEEEPQKPKEHFMGCTFKTKNDLDDFVEKIAKAWTADKYNVLSHNCHHFAQEILNCLKINKPIPSEYTVSADIASFAISGLSVAATGAILAPIFRIGMTLLRLW